MARSFVRPWLPPFLNEARILNLVANADVELAVVRHVHDVSVEVLRKRGPRNCGRNVKLCGV